MKTTRINEIAESFINGNISWCKAQLYGKRDAKFAVYERLQDVASKLEADSFYRLVLKG